MEIFGEIIRDGEGTEIKLNFYFRNKYIEFRIEIMMVLYFGPIIYTKFNFILYFTS